MRCMQALVRAQARVRARRLTTHFPPLLLLPPPPKTPPAANCSSLPGRHPPRLDLALLHGDHDASDDDGEAAAADAALLQQQQQQRSTSRGRLGKGDGNNGGGRSPSGGWDGSSRTLEDARAEGARRHDAAARRERALAYAYAYQQRQWQRQQEEENAGVGGGLGFQWLERWMAAQAPDHARASYATAATAGGGTMSEKTAAEMDASFRSPLNPASATAHERRPPAIPGYMAATRSARARARTTAPPPPSHVRSRSGGGLAGDTSSSGQSGGALAGYSPESSCTGDCTPPRLGVSTRTSRVAYA
uniref:DUF4005 domain-containing protein n=1 Tax=Arundo donax TaxID=35708 RepID=A0A0A9CU48_ARUDO